MEKTLNRVDRLSKKIGTKRALIGGGMGLATGLGASYLYNRLRNKNENK
jgi:hypothetical protein